MDPPTSYICLRNLRFDAVIGRDAWGRMKPQPVQASVRLQRNIHKAGMTDNVDETLSYSTMCKRILKTAQTFEEQDSQSLNQVTAFHTMLHSTVRDEKGPDRELGRLEIETTMPKAILGAAGLTFKSISEYSHTDSNNLVTSAGGLCINGLRGNCIIGVNPHERLHKQPVDIDLSYNFASIDPSKDNPQALAEAALKATEGSEFLTVEALAYHIAEHLQQHQIPNLTIAVHKPFAITAVEGAGVEITCGPPGAPRQ